MAVISIATGTGLPVSRSELTAEQHLWACAHTVRQQHGDSAGAFVAKRIGALRQSGDLKGVAMWAQIASRLDQLVSESGELQ